MSQFCRSILILNILGEFFCQRIFNLFYMRRLVVSSVEIVCDMFSEKWIHLGFPCQHQYLRGNSITPLAHFLSHLCCIFWWLFAFLNFEFSYNDMKMKKILLCSLSCTILPWKNVWRQNVWGVSPLFGWLVFGRRRCFVAEAGKKP